MSMKYVKNRPALDELKQLNIVILSGISEKYPTMRVAGWVEDAPHHDSDEAIVLYEPLYFHDTNLLKLGDRVGVSFSVQSVGVPYATEFFEYTKVEIYEGISPFGLFYGTSLIGSSAAPGARGYKPTFECVFAPLKVVPQPATGPVATNHSSSQAR